MPRSFTRIVLLGCAVFGIFITSMVAAEPSIRQTGPWNLDALMKTPAATWGKKEGLVQEVYYESEPFEGHPTRVFAYVARPENATGPIPAMVLVHGGGGKAFADWATLWAQRGYAAIAMDLRGNGPDGQRLPDGGPEQSDHTLFRDFTDAEINQMWTYHAVAAVLRGHSLLASCEGIDANRIGITGISWGGYLTCIAAGLDHRLKLAVPVYGCGFIHGNSTWAHNTFSKMTPERRARWASLFDPSQYLPGATCPMLFVNGTNDFAYPLDSYQKSYRLPTGPVTVRIELRFSHGHGIGWQREEIGLFADSLLRGGEPLPKLGPMTTTDGRVSAEFTSAQPIVKGQLLWTSATGEWQKREWHAADAAISGATVSAELPKERPLVYLLNVIDQRGAMVSTQHETLP